jgi:hypothetical protein
MAVRASLRSVLEEVTVADLSSGDLPASVRRQVEDYHDAEAARGRAVESGDR